MAGNLLNIGKTGLYAAQAGLATTGHNIANANVTGYSRQTVVQSSTTAQDMGYGFVGSGTQVAEIKRFSDEFLNVQVRNAQSATSALNAYNAQASQVDNLIADSTTGLAPSMQDFFKAVQDVSANAASTPSRQAFLSAAETLAARFQGLNGQMQDIRDGVNSQVTSNVTLINSYASQIAKLNDQISTLSNATGNAPNDLLDARDQLVLDLNKQVKATAMKGDNNTVTVSIGAGQPLVVGSKAFQLAATVSPTDPSRVEVGYLNGSKTTILSDASLSGGELGGLLDFRSNTLDPAQNALGRVAMTLAATFNAQNRLGQDASGKMGGDLFAPAPPAAGINKNTMPPDAANPSTVTATLVDPSQLTTSDYLVSYDQVQGAFTVKTLADPNKPPVTLPAYTQPGPQTAVIDGLSFSISGQQVAGDAFVVRPTANGAHQFAVAAKSIADIAAAGPMLANVAAGNRGAAKVSEGTVDASFTGVFPPATLKFEAATGELSGFPNGATVNVTVAGVTTPYLAGTDTIPFTDGASYTFNGATVSFNGKPVDQDKFTVGRTPPGGADNRNLLAMGQLQSKPIIDNGSATYQSAFAQIVSTVGNKAREVQVNGEASAAMLAQATSVQQSVSGVNLDEEAANLLKYQQAYQAAGKVMQIASTLFDTLLSLGR